MSKPKILPFPQSDNGGDNCFKLRQGDIFQFKSDQYSEAPNEIGAYVERGPHDFGWFYKLEKTSTGYKSRLITKLWDPCETKSKKIGTMSAHAFNQLKTTGESTYSDGAPYISIELTFDC